MIFHIIFLLRALQMALRSSQRHVCFVCCSSCFNSTTPLWTDTAGTVTWLTWFCGVCEWKRLVSANGEFVPGDPFTIGATVGVSPGMACPPGIGNAFPAGLFWLLRSLGGLRPTGACFDLFLVVILLCCNAGLVVKKR